MLTFISIVLHKTIIYIPFVLPLPQPVLSYQVVVFFLKRLHPLQVDIQYLMLAGVRYHTVVYNVKISINI